MALGVTWLAFVLPMFSGKVHFPTDFATYFFPVNVTKVTSNLADTDAFNAVYPWRDYLGDQLASGHLPLWDPSRFLGVPFAADVSTGTFYPLNWLFAFGDVPFVTTVIWAITLLLSLLLTYWFLRVLELHPFAAAFGALTWTFGGFMAVWAAADPLLGAAVWLPLALGGIEVARRGRPGKGLPLAALGLALSALAGHIQISYYVWFIAGIWVLVTTVATAMGARRTGGQAVLRALARGAALGLGVFVLAAGLASVQIIGGLQYAGQVVRQDASYAVLQIYKIAPSMLKTALLPDFFGNPINHNYKYLPPLYTEDAMFMGILALPLAVAGLRHRRRRLSVFFGVLLVVGVAAGFGTPLLHVLVAVLPALSRFRGINRFILLIDFGLMGLAALGFDAILTHSPAAARTALACTLIVTLIAAYLGLARPGTTVHASYLTPRALREIAILGAGALLLITLVRLRAKPGAMELAALGLLVLVGVDLWLFGYRYHPFERDTPVVQATPAVVALAGLPGARPRYAQVEAEQLPPNVSMDFGLYSIDGYDPFVPDGVIKLRPLFDPGLPQGNEVDNSILPLQEQSTEPPVLNLLGVGALTTPDGLPNEAGNLIYAGPFSIYAQPQAFPPAFMATCWGVAADGSALDQMQSMSTSELRSTAIVAAGQGVSAVGPPAGECSAGADASVQNYGPQRVTVNVPAASGGGMLVLSDQWYPGWTATVDGRPATILRVDVALRGIALPSGAHSVVFTYRPLWPLQGLAVTLLTLVVIELLITASWKYRDLPD